MNRAGVHASLATALLVLSMASVLAAPAQSRQPRHREFAPMFIAPPQGARPVQEFRLGDEMLARVKEKSPAFAEVQEIIVRRFVMRRAKPPSPETRLVLDHFNRELAAKGWVSLLQQTEGNRGAAYASPDAKQLLAVVVQPDGFTVSIVKGSIALEQIPELEKAMVRLFGAERTVLPPSARSALAEARSLDKSGKRDQAIALLLKTIEQHPRLVGLRTDLADIYKRADRKPERIAQLKAAVALDPTSYNSRLDYAKALYDSELLKDALFEFSQAAGLAPDKATPIYFVGRIYQDQNQMPEAIRAYRQVAELAPHWLSVHMRLGSLYEQQNDLKSAAVAYTKATQIAPKSDEAKTALARVSKSVR